ncbi:MAG: exo-alpha-sialidase [Bacteroidetes bacterium]|nr:exo-alpha-sialidase [Bacteroidota bacterium]
MKVKLLLISIIISAFWILNSGFSPNDDDPRWNNPSTRIDINPIGSYTALPEGDNRNFSNETRYFSTPQGVFAVGPNFRVHPTTARTQSETPITRHPTNPNIMFGSANTYNVGGTTTFSTGHYVTTDGGVTWFGDDTTVFNYGDPAPMIMSTNRLVITFLTSAGPLGSSYSDNFGSTWSGITYIPGGAGTGVDKNLSAVDVNPYSAYKDRLYTVYTEFSGAYANRIVATYSTDGGVSWSNIVPVSPVPSAGHHHQGCDLTVDIYGWVRVVYANCTTNGQNSTEDYLGWAESGTGGTSWSDMSDTKVNTNGIRSADFLTPSSSIIRANGFPRIATDRSCLPSRDDDYVVMAEKNFAPALDNGDIVLMKTPDGGATWTRTRVNQNPAGSYEWCPAVDVDATGGINVCYYSTRNVPTNDSAEIYLSRSTDGGVTFVDIKVSDHKFKPIPISGTAAGYQGDYIGITNGGEGKILPYWCEQNTSTGGRYQAYTSLVDITSPRPCEDFSCAIDSGTSTTPFVSTQLFEQYSGTNYWGRKSIPSAYGIGGTGAARFNSWSASTGTVQSLTSYDFPSTFLSTTTYLTFDEAYRPWSGGNVDSLIVETSANSGATWNVFAKLWGGLGAQAGPLNTVFTGGGQFTPSTREWRSKIYKLPYFTNKVRLRARSGFGNDIWVDNVCVQTLATPVSNTIGLLNQGMFIPTNPYWNYEDTVTVFLYRQDFPNIAVDSASSVMGPNAVTVGLDFQKALTGDYYKVVRHRNALETWSAVAPTYTRGANTNYNFVPNNASYGNNMATVSTSPFYKGQYSGDCNQDDFIDVSDLTIIDNQAFNFASGYVIGDLNGDFFADISDYAIADNNAFNFVGLVAPPGAEPVPVNTNDNVPELKTEQDRIKYELHKKVISEQLNQQQTQEKESPVLNEVLKQRLERSKINKAPIRREEKIQVKTPEENSSNGLRVGER